MIKQNFENKAFKLNKDLKDKKTGEILNLKVDKNGVPIEQYWRRRLKDSKIDNCMEPVKAKKEAKK